LRTGYEFSDCSNVQIGLKGKDIMIEIGLKNIEKSYGADKIINNVSFEVHSHDRIGLIGRNGTGKTTILKIISGRERYNNGVLSIRKGATIGYLDQIPIFPESFTAMDVLNTVFKEAFEMKEKMNLLEEQLSKETDKGIERKIEAYGELQFKFEQLGGYDIDTRIDKICTGLRIDKRMQNQPFNSLSGGEKTIVGLSKTLLQSCDILLLDEPTNHLDIASLSWLEEFLRTYKGAAVIISHDRYFLDQTVTKIIELEDGKSDIYHGNYSWYVQEKEDRLMAQFEAHKNQEKKIKAMQKAVKRFRDWGARADNPKMFKKAKQIENRIEKMVRIEKPLLDSKKIKLHFSGDMRSGKDVIWGEKVKQSFADKIIFSDADFSIRYSERVALFGKNGSGKTTLMKMILRQRKPDSGDIIVGASVTNGYLAQKVSFKDENQTILAYIRRQLLVDEGRSRNLLASFLFYKDDVFKKIKDLSGGEKARLKLCELMHQDINLLLLDEPTNHLDIDSREMLEDALSDFTGTILFISHDRYFINKLSKRILAIEEGKLVEYFGNYDDYRDKVLRIKNDFQNHDTRALKPESEEGDKSSLKIRRKIENKKKILEARIGEIESNIKQKETEMEKHPADYEKQRTLYEEKCILQQNLDRVFAEWLTLEEDQSGII